MDTQEVFDTLIRNRMILPGGNGTYSDLLAAINDAAFDEIIPHWGKVLAENEVLRYQDLLRKSGHEFHMIILNTMADDCGLLYPLIVNWQSRPQTVDDVELFICDNKEG